MPKNLGLYNESLSVPRKQDVDAVASRVNANEDNIAMLDSDIAAAQGDITTLKGNVTTLTTALQSKQDKIVGGASTITDDNLTANRALVSNGSGKVAVSAVTATELGYLDGVTSNIQTQLNKKLESAPVTSVNTKTGAVVLTATDVGALPTSGGTLTGNLTVGSAKIQTNGYVVGTWLQGTATNHLTNAATKIAVQDGSGWVYHRTAEEIKSDIGLSNVDNVKQYSASNPPPYPVVSVNGQTGDVVIEAGGGTTIVLSASQPSGLKAGDYWYQIVT